MPCLHGHCIGLFLQIQQSGYHTIFIYVDFENECVYSKACIHPAHPLSHAGLVISPVSLALPPAAVVECGRWKGGDTVNLNETNRVLLTEALNDLLAYIQEGITHLPHVSTDDINQNTLAIASAKIKLGRIPGEKLQQFSAQELKVMYWALKNFRDDTQDLLDSLSLSDSDRNDAIDAYRSANALLRELRTESAQIGLELADLFQND